MIDLQIFVPADHRNAEGTAHIVLGIIQRSFQHHAFVCLLEVHNMCTALAGASPTLLAAGESCRKKRCQYDESDVSFHIFVLLSVGPMAIARKRHDHRVYVKEYRTFIVQSNRISPTSALVVRNDWSDGCHCEQNKPLALSGVEGAMTSTATVTVY
ncbi:MAG: hypothetical protein ACYTBS_04670 [Planctomycetota bacterium]|jgi:hypothetical protein